MKKFLLFIIFSFVCIYSQAQKDQTIQTKEIKVSETASDSCKTSQTDKIYEIVDQMPSFPGGTKLLFWYLSTHLKYPAKAQRKKIQGRVIVSFVVEYDGSITDIQIEHPVDPSLDREAIRVVSSMPNWIPGKQKGSPVRVKYNLPIAFKLR